MNGQTAAPIRSWQTDNQLLNEADAQQFIAHWTANTHYLRAVRIIAETAAVNPHAAVKQTLNTWLDEQATRGGDVHAREFDE